MPISGLVISLSEKIALRESALSAIAQEPRIEIGAQASRRMSVVVDTQSSEEDKELWDWLNGLPGVDFVDVVLVGFEEQDPSQAESSTVRCQS